MELLLKRIAKKEDYTIGRLFINGERFCDTLEDTDRGLDQKMPLKEIKSRKVYGQTAIPTGTYDVTMTMSAHFKRVLPSVNNVPGYEGIRVHAGNTAKDSLGCILVGVNNVVGRVNNSRKTENALCAILRKCKEPIHITIE